MLKPVPGRPRRHPERKAGRRDEEERERRSGHPLPRRKQPLAGKRVPPPPQAIGTRARGA